MDIIDKITNDVPQLKRGLVWCRKCGAGPIKVEQGLRNGWPKCCGQTMTIDSPEEQHVLAERK